MSFEAHKATIQQFVDGINQANLDVIDRLLAPSFFNHEPEAGEETAPEVLRPIIGDLTTAFPDLHITVSDFAESEGLVTFQMEISGTHRNDLWGAPANDVHSSWTSTVTSRFVDGKFAFCWEDLPLPGIMGKLREIGLVPPAEDMDKPPKYPVVVPEFLLKVVLTGQAADKPCSHRDLIRVVEPTTDVCQDCVDAGDIWPALRMCLVCGYVGCCDTSKNKHMKQHYEKTGHPIFRSIRLNERWVWCYEDDAFFTGKLLDEVA